MNDTPLSRLAAAINDWSSPAQTELRGFDPASVGPALRQKAETLFRLLVPLAAKAVKANGRAVISLFGGSGAGKSGSAALLEAWFRASGIGCLTVNGDNYPHRIPMYNDAERLRLFRVGGLKALRAAGLYTVFSGETLHKLWEHGLDADLQAAAEYPWLSVYQAGGQAALEAYLGTALEQDYDEVNALLDAFHAGAETLWLKRMGRTEDARWYEAADGRDIPLLLLEWTHGGSELVRGVDIPVLLLGTTAETLPYRQARNRDADTDTPFTTMVLNIEQEKILARAGSAALILSRDGQVVTADRLGG